MKKVLVIGAGKSSHYLIEYLLKHAEDDGFLIRVIDLNDHHIDIVFKKSPLFRFEKADMTDDTVRQALIKDADIVISMLPAFMHILVAKDCLAFGKNLITPSYISPEMKALNNEVASKNLLFMNELGVDPGIDHMSAMYIIEKLKSKNANIIGFESFTGGLIAPESDNNPWHYKFTWNPRNVVLAGQGIGGVKFIHNGMYKYIPYHKLFKRTEIVKLAEHGDFEGYANRDSLKYREAYGLQNIKTMYRGTFRKPGYCRGWSLLIDLGMTDDSYQMEDCEHMSYRDFTNSFLKYRKTDSVEIKLAHYLNIDWESDEMEMIKWLGLLNPNKKVGLKNASPAQILQKILEEKWSMQKDDKDMIVMYHKFNYHFDDQVEHELKSYMIVKGENSHLTAMAKTVGLPLAIAARLIINEKIKAHGVLLPLHKEIYLPILRELKEYGIHFVEEEMIVTN